MAGALTNPVQVTGTLDMSTGQTPSPSYLNLLRISAVIQRLIAHFRGGSQNDNTEFFNLCLSLARGIDYAVADNEIPDRAPDLPNLLKQVCQRRTDALLHAAIMVLMISVKSACRNGWFSEKDNEELHILSNEIASSFCSVRDMNCEESTFFHSISAVMSRFYPTMNMGEILAFVEAKMGYGAFVKDFYISKNAKCSPDKLYLFVARTDDIETSSCITSPQQVNFLLNGKAVDRRTCVCKDPGPQIPTPVTHMLKCGTNLLQAVGQFNGDYIIVVAFMSVVSNPSCPVLPDYVPPAAAAPDSDNEIIEGPSRISLNCPISFRRIQTPVKGHLCKHLQCFDFDYYVGINSRIPSWRCPYCSQSVCFQDIRIDQSMVKVLKEVGANVSHVKIFADGSWKAVTEDDDHTAKPYDKAPLHQESTSFQDEGAYVLDLTEGDNDMDASNTHQDNGSKPSAQFQDQPNVINPVPSYMNMNNVHRNIAPHMEEGFWKEIYLQTYAAGTSNARPDITLLAPGTGAILNGISHGQSQREIHLPTYAAGTSNARSDVTVLAHETDAVLNAISQGQSQNVASQNMQLQQYNHSNNISNEYGRYPTPARQVMRIPIAVQALPAQTSTGMVSGDRQQLFSRSHINPHQGSHMTSAPPSQHMGSQNWIHHDRSHLSSPPVQQFGAHPPQQTRGDRYTSGLPADGFNSHQQQFLNQRILHPVHSPAHLSPQVCQGSVGPTTDLGSSQQPLPYTMAGTQVRSWTPSIPTPIQTSGSFMSMALPVDQRGPGQSPRVLEGLAIAEAVENWRPTRRMRGSLSGRAYSDDLNQLIIYPTQPVQAANPPVLNTPRPVIPPDLQALMLNYRNAHSSLNGASDSGIR